MKLDFQAIPETVVPHFKDGEGEAHIRKYNDPQMGSIVNITLPVGSSIGLHTHKGNCEIVYVLSGAGTYIDDGETSYHRNSARKSGALTIMGIADYDRVDKLIRELQYNVTHGDKDEQ